jgi:hypothetical protein
MTQVLNKRLGFFPSQNQHHLEKNLHQHT